MSEFSFPSLWEELCLKSNLCSRPRSGLNENSPALQRWLGPNVIDKSVKRTLKDYGSRAFNSAVR
jgi:hypothetical protein